MSGGATIYDGDRLETQEDGILRVRLGKSQMELRPSTTVEVHRLPNGFVTSLFRGTVAVSSPEGQTFELLANGARIRLVGTQETVAQVTWVNSNELRLTSKLGAIQVLYEGDVKTIESGNSYGMEIPSEDPRPPGPARPRSHKGVKYFLIVAAPVGTAIGIWRALESPSCPQP
jgi:ferric-dicitrate binding protein FerR (iron transport regulator)